MADQNVVQMDNAPPEDGEDGGAVLTETKRPLKALYQLYLLVLW